MDDKQKKAHAEYMRRWRLENLERAREISRAGSAKYNARNPERKRQSSRESARRLRVPRRNLDPDQLDRLREEGRRHYKDKAERDPSYVPRKREHGKKWRAENPELARQTVREAMQRWRARNPDKVLERAERYREKKKAQQLQMRQAMRAALLQFFGGKCVRCGFAEGAGLQLDHINGNGNKERKAGKGNKRDQYALIKSDPDAARAKYQLLCATCNIIKQAENMEYRKAK